MVEMCLIPAQMLISLSLPRLPKQTPLFTHSLSTHLALSARSLSTRSLIAAIEGEDRTWLIDTYPPRTRTRSLQMISLSPTIHSPNSNQTAEDDDQPISRRIQRLSLHLNPPPIHPDRQVTDALELQSCASRTKLSVSTQQLSDYIRGKHRDIQERVFEYFNSRPDLQTPVEISKDDHRELCMRQLLGLVREARIRPFRYVADDPSKYFAIAEAVGSVDMSLGIKMGVQ